MGMTKKQKPSGKMPEGFRFLDKRFMIFLFRFSDRIFSESE